MPAHNRGELSLEGYLLRVLAALCRQSGGELRISGAEVDRVGEATSLIKEWDAEKQQVVLRVETIAFREVFRLNPEKQTPQVTRPAAVVDIAGRSTTAPPPQPRPPAAAPEDEFLPRRVLVNEDAALMEQASKRTVARAAAIIREHLRSEERKRQREEERIPV